MENTLDQEIFLYISHLTEAKKKSILQLLKTFTANDGEIVERISIEQYNQEIDEALEEVERGDYISQEEMEKRAAKW